MKNSIIELKRVKTFRGHDGVGLDCDLYVDGKKVCRVFDSAHGGENEYQAYGNSPEEYKANYKIINDLEEYAKTLPKKKFGSELGGGEYSQDLGSIINDLLEVIESEKFAKKLEKKFLTHIIVGIPNGTSYREFSYGKPVVQLSTLPKARLQADIDALKAKLKEGEQILNTNIDELLTIN